MAGLGLLFGTLIAIAHRTLHVEEDPKLEAVESMLPGTNCGACGQPGCQAFAERLVAGDVQPSGCTVSSPAAIAAIAEFLGVAAGEPIKRVARLRCAGGRAEALQIAAYEGAESCRAASVVSGGGKGCAWGCLGLADCERACDFDAIHMNANGLPVVDVDKCTACNDCVIACPKDLFELLPMNQPVLVQCVIPLAGERATALCRVACDACGRCAQDAPESAITMVNGLPVVDYTYPETIQPAVTFRCPTRAIQWVPGNQFDAPQPVRSPGRHA